MEKRDALFLLLVLGGGGYAAYTHWDVIADKLSFDSLSPGRIKAVNLAKDSSDFEQGFRNWQWLQTQQKRGTIQMAEDPWSAEPIAGEDYTVLARWVADGDPMVVRFRVNIAKRTVAYDGALDTPASPR
ncbi:MAG: hypothetical protein JNM25_00495 [Planctomycetes bacterium]|nr:hypothetical protein [Planctomycetota bacterium]